MSPEFCPGIWVCPFCWEPNDEPYSKPESGTVRCGSCGADISYKVVQSGKLGSNLRAFYSTFALPFAVGVSTWVICNFVLGWDGFALWASSIGVLAVAFGLWQESFRRPS